MFIKKSPAIDKLMSNAKGIPLDLTDQLLQKLRSLPESPRRDYLIAEVTSKYVSKDTDPADHRRARAILKWLAQEAENEATNVRLLTTHAEYNILPRVTYASFVDRCCSIVRDIIGDVPPTDALIGAFSGGASTSRKRTSSQPAGKYLGKVHATRRCYDYFCDYVAEEVPGWLLGGSDFACEVVPGNVLFTVPKKTDIDRVAAKEPDLNMFIQKGVGNHFRNSLRRVGINLRDQGVNRSLALVGSKHDSLATLDLSSASDSVTTELVATLLPVCWFNLLDTVRCHVTTIDGEEHSNEMFSSMGNGFTFELESLLFYSIARTVAYFRGTSGIISVYGDDLIVPRDMSHYFQWVLSYLGFSVNTEKTFHEGAFRESCGGHYLYGDDITPFYIRKPIETVVDVMHVANSLRAWAGPSDRVGSWGRLTYVLDCEIEEVWLWLKDFVPECLWGGGDTSFKYQLVSYDTSHMRVQPETRARSTGIGGYYHWLNATWARTGTIEDPTVTSRHSKDLGLGRLRPVRDRAVPRLEALFLHEIERVLESK